MYLGGSVVSIRWHDASVLCTRNLKSMSPKLALAEIGSVAQMSMRRHSIVKFCWVLGLRAQAFGFRALAGGGGGGGTLYFTQNPKPHTPNPKP